MAQSSPPSFVASTSLCPEATQVEQEILGLTPTLYRGVLTNQIHIQMDDTGAEYTVAVFDGNLRATKSFLIRRAIASDAFDSLQFSSCSR